MKIAFDSQLFLKGNKTGIAWNAYYVMIELADKVDGYCNFFSRNYTEELTQIQGFQKYGLKLNPCGWFHDVLYKMIWPFIPVPYSWFFGRDAEITQFFNCVIPPGVKGKKVVFIYDMAFKVYPETTRAKTRRWLELTLRQSCRRADSIVTVSEFSKKEIMRYMGVKSDKITVMHCGVDLSLYRPDFLPEEIADTAKTYKIAKKYFLYLGTLEPRKNIERLIEAYKRMKEETENSPIMVIAGGKGWLYDSIFTKVKQLGLEQDILFTGYVKSKDVPLLMAGAEAFVFPSLYEGFGLPPLEAMACGTPVITSDVSSLPEVVGEAAILVDPLNVQQIADAMQVIAADENKRGQLRKLGLEQAKKYTWDRAAGVLIKLYEDLIR